MAEGFVRVQDKSVLELAIDSIFVRVASLDDISIVLFCAQRLQG